MACFFYMRSCLFMIGPDEKQGNNILISLDDRLFEKLKSMWAPMPLRDPFEGAECPQTGIFPILPATVTVQGRAINLSYDRALR